jgi:hypothetical protein
MQIHVICLHRPWHLSQFSVHTTEASGRRGNFKCKFRRHLIWHIDRSGPVRFAPSSSRMALKCKLARSDRNTMVLLTTTGSDSWTVTSLLRTEPALQDTLHEQRALPQTKLKTQSLECVTTKLYAVRWQGVSATASHLRT